MLLCIFRRHARALAFRTRRMSVGSPSSHSEVAKEIQTPKQSVSGRSQVADQLSKIVVLRCEVQEIAPPFQLEPITILCTVSKSTTPDVCAPCTLPLTQCSVKISDAVERCGHQSSHRPCDPVPLVTDTMHVLAFSEWLAFISYA